MHLIDSSTAVSVMPNPRPTGTPGWFSPPELGQGATRFTYEWCNALQAEITHVITSQGITLDKANNTQLLTAIQAVATAAVPNLLSSNNTWTGTNTHTNTVTITASGSGSLTLANSAAASTAISAGMIYFKANDNGSNPAPYAQIEGWVTDDTAAHQNGELLLNVWTSGSPVTAITVAGTSVTIAPAVTCGSTVNATNYLTQGVAGNAYGARYISTSPPSSGVGNDGDIHYMTA